MDISNQRYNRINQKKGFWTSKSVYFLFILFLSFLANDLYAADFYEDQTLKTIDFIGTVFNSTYAPRDWKKKQTGWNIEDEVAKAKTAVQEKGNQLDIVAVQAILRRLIGGTKDYHVGIYFHATEKATLPLEIHSAENKFYIVWIDRSKLPEKTFPLMIGDEVLRFNGKAILEERQSILDTLSSNVLPTDLAISEMLLTRRSASMGLKVPKGLVDIEVKRTKDGKTNIFKRQLIWDYQDEKINLLSADIASHSEQKTETQHYYSVSQKEMTWGQWKLLEPMTTKENENPYRMGARKSFTPLLGTILWESAPETNFYAYTFRTTDSKIYGYIRIPSYMSGEKEAKEFLSIVKRMEETTDALVIDQVNNPGGSVFYLYALVSMLTRDGEEMATPKHRMTITQADIESALTEYQKLEEIKGEEEAKKIMGETLSGYPVSYSLAQFFKEYNRFLMDEWKRGSRFSSPYYLGLDKIQPHPEGHYTKPILLLINELDFSGGDFFPAILQDNHRATLMGVRTAGAGGYVRGVEFPNLLGIAGFSLTGSIAERVDLNPIENLGVQPDIQYQFTAKDLGENFVSYKEKILEQLKTMISKQEQKKQ